MPKLGVSFHENLRTVYYKIPLGMRRFLFKKIQSSQYDRLESMRYKTNLGVSTLKPYDDFECIFVHIPKCGGNSIADGLFGTRSAAHLSIANYQLLFSTNEFDRYFKFAFVRNPWSRVYSAYKYLKYGQSSRVNIKWAEENLSEFDDFNIFVRNWMTKENIYKKVHFHPQCRFLFVPQSSEPLVDYLGYFENLSVDFEYVKCKIKGKSNVKLQHLNRTKGATKNEYLHAYDDEAKKIVGDLYSRDIKELGYIFDNSTLSIQLAERNVHYGVR